MQGYGRHCCRCKDSEWLEISGTRNPSCHVPLNTSSIPTSTQINYWNHRYSSTPKSSPRTIRNIQSYPLTRVVHPSNIRLPTKRGSTHAEQIEDRGGCKRGHSGC